MQRRKVRITRRHLVLCGVGLLALLLLSCPAPIGEDLLLQIRDEMGPVITIMSPQDGSSCSQTVVVVGLAEDPTGSPGEDGSVEALWYEVPGSDASGTGIVATDGTFTFQFPTDDLGPSFLLSVTAEDWSGNRSTLSITLKKIEGNDIPSFSAVPGNHSVTLSWENVPLASDYTLYYTDNGSMPSEQYGSKVEHATSPHPLTNLVNGSRHVFVLQAHSSEGPDNWSAPAETIPLSSFSLLPRVRGEPGRISLEWNSIPGTSTFEVWRAPEKDGDYINISGAVEGNAYADTMASADQLYFYRVTTPSAPGIESGASSGKLSPFPGTIDRLVQSVDTDGWSYSVWVSETVDGTYAYLADATAGLVVVDVSTPGSAFVAATYPTPDSAYDVVVAGDYAYVMHNGGLIILDVSVPESPQLEGQLDTILYGDDVEIIGGYAVVLGHYEDADGIHIVDIDPPSSPHVVDTYYGDYEGIAVSTDGQYVYAVDPSSPQTLDVISIADPLNLPSTPTGSYVLPEITTYFDLDVTVSGNYALVGLNDAGLVMLDISELSYASVAGGFSTPGYARDVFILGDYAYVAGSDPGPVILDISPPANPAHLATVDLPGDVSHLAIQGDRAFVADGSSRLQLIDISTPSSPQNSGYYDGFTTIADVAAVDDYAFVVDYDTGLHILDVSDPAAPTLVSTYTLSGCGAVEIHGEYALLTAVMAGRLHVLDISNLSEITPLGTYDMPGRAVSIRTHGDLALVTGSWDYGFQILDISDTRSLRYVSRFDGTWLSLDVEVSDNYAFACGYTSLQVVDLTIPSSPTAVSSLPALVPFEAYNDIEISGPYGFVAFGESGVQILSVSNPKNPYPVIEYDTPGWTEELEISGKHAFVADGDNGLVILDLAPCFD